MPKRQPNIRWRQRDLDELQRTIKNVNAKIGRLQKKNPDRVDALPSKFSKEQLMNEIETRSDYNKIIESLQKFSSLRSAGKLPDENAKIQKTAWEIKYQKLRAEIANERIADKRKELEHRNVKRGGKDTGNKRSQMGKIRENEGKPINTNIDKKKNTEEFEKAVRNIDAKLNKQVIAEKQNKMRENYLKGLTDYGFLDNDKTASELKKYIMGVSQDTFVNTVVDDEMGSFEWYKDPQEFATRLQGLIDTWKTAYNEENGKG